MSYFIFKALHIIAVITWFAGLFYIVRLFIYHTEAQAKMPSDKQVLSEQFKIMERRLWYGITWPSAIVVLIFGLGLLHYFPLSQNPWLVMKLILVTLLYAYHFYCGKLFKELKQDQFRFTSSQLRMFNEVPTLLLFLIVFLVVLKGEFTFKVALTLCLTLSILLIFGVRMNAKRLNLKK